MRIDLPNITESACTEAYQARTRSACGRSGERMWVAPSSWGPPPRPMEEGWTSNPCIREVIDSVDVVFARIPQLQAFATPRGPLPQHRRICRCCAATCPLPVSIRQALPERSARLLFQPRARAHPPQVVEEGEIGWPRILRCLGQSKWNRLSHGRSHRRQEVRKQHDEQPCVRCRMERQRCRAVLAEVDEHRPVDHVVDHSPHRVEYH